MDLSDPDSSLVQREVVLLVVLTVVATLAFVLTREVAQRERTTNLSDAAQWFAIGERQLREGASADAVDSLRRATSADRSSRAYVLTLARALAANLQQDEARGVLLGLRETVPDDPDVSIELARLAADRQDVTEAQRFYQNALYGIWPTGREDERLRLRVELILFLLQHDDDARALSEVVALTANIPEQAASHTEAGQLFLAAGDPERALGQFTRALLLAPTNDDALAGAGEASFARADYTGARRYFSRAASLPEGLGQLNEVARLVLAQDPLTLRLPLAARRDRLRAGVTRAGQRLDECRLAQPAAAAALDPISTEVTGLLPQLESRTLRDQPELVDNGVDLIYRAERAAADACGEPTGLDRALLLVGERHRGQP